MSRCEHGDPVVNREGQVVRVSTCPFCLPAGAITWLIENGRQLDLFEASPLPSRGFSDIVDKSISVSAFDSTLEDHDVPF